MRFEILVPTKLIYIAIAITKNGDTFRSHQTVSKRYDIFHEMMNG